MDHHGINGKRNGEGAFRLFRSLPNPLNGRRIACKKEWDMKILPNPKYKLIITLFLVFLLYSCSSENPTVPVLNDLSKIPTLMKVYNVPGISIAVIKDFQIDTLIVFGVKDRNTNEPVTKQTLFAAASISKPVSAMATLKFVQEGSLSLDENVNNKLSSWKVPESNFTITEKVTLRRLLSHTAGVNWLYSPGYQMNSQIPTLVQILNGEPPANTARLSIVRIPGSEFHYTNLGFCVIQQVLMDITQQSFPELMQQTVLIPLGMENSLFEQPLPAVLHDKASSGHDLNGEVLPGKFYVYPELAAAGLWTTAEDLAKFVIEIQLSLKGQSNRVISQQMINQMITPISILDDLTSYGLGIGIHKVKNEIYFAHGAGFRGFKGRIFSHIETGVGVVILINKEETEKFRDEIIKMIAQMNNWPGFSN